MTLDSKQSAQQRIDQIQAFKSEMALLATEVSVTFDDEQSLKVANYHQQVITDLTRTWDVDVDASTRYFDLRSIAHLSGNLYSAHA